MANIIEVLQERGLIEAVTSEDINELVKQPIKVYCGFDPTAESLHLGNLVAIMGLAWFQRYGHTPVAIVGGATGMIGDPSGKRKERKLLDEVAIGSNLKGIKANLDTILGNGKTFAILNNYDWFKDFSFIQFLRDVGKNFRMGPMLAKDSVRSRLNSEEGMSFTEFSYQLLQAYDFLYLSDKHGIAVQLGGSDQWGNIVAGTDLIRRLRGKNAYGVTFPLLTDGTGQKLGKTEKGAVWLSEEKLSPYEFYQYFFRIEDGDVIKLLKMLTFLELDEIQEIEASMHKHDYRPNMAQEKLAEEVTRLVHGEKGLARAQAATVSARPGGLTSLNAEDLERIAGEMPNCSLTYGQVVGSKLIDLFVASGLQQSKGQVRRLLKNGGVYMNNRQISDEHLIVQEENLLGGRLLLLSAGKKNKLLIRLQL